MVITTFIVLALVASSHASCWKKTHNVVYPADSTSGPIIEGSHQCRSLCFDLQHLTGECSMINMQNGNSKGSCVRVTGTPDINKRESSQTFSVESLAAKCQVEGCWKTPESQKFKMKKVDMNLSLQECRLFCMEEYLCKLMSYKDGHCYFNNQYEDVEGADFGTIKYLTITCKEGSCWEKLLNYALKYKSNAVVHENTNLSSCKERCFQYKDCRAFDHQHSTKKCSIIRDASLVDVYTKSSTGFSVYAMKTGCFSV